jgi:membrane-bound serine protease (ClpP class)
MRQLFSLVVLFITMMGVPAGAQSENLVVMLSANGPLTPAMAEYLERGIRWAEENDAEAIVLNMDTPGGQTDLMNRMVQAIRASEVPVIVYVEPRGAIAGSAGMVIVLAGHAAAMAPETAIGAASPVGGQGEDLGETIQAKQKEIMKATIRSLAAGRRDKAIALAEAAIDDAKAASALEALSVGMIDAVVDGTEELFTSLDGYTVQLAIGERILDLENVTTIETIPSNADQSKYCVYSVDNWGSGNPDRNFEPGRLGGGVYWCGGSCTRRLWTRCPPRELVWSDLSCNVICSFCSRY